MSQKETNSRTDLLARSVCPVTNTLDILGDKWTLLVIRDLFLGKSTYKQLQDSAEAIPSNILAERLKRLERYAIVEKKPYQTNPLRYNYCLTQKGRELEPILLSLKQWGEKHIAGSQSLLT